MFVCLWIDDVKFLKSMLMLCNSCTDLYLFDIAQDYKSIENGDCRVVTRMEFSFLFIILAAGLFLAGGSLLTEITVFNGKINACLVEHLHRIDYVLQAVRTWTP